MTVEDRIAQLESLMKANIDFARQVMEHRETTANAISVLQEEVFSLKAQAQVLSDEVASLIESRDT